ncbi:unnamed protein product, partial [Brassica napus]
LGAHINGLLPLMKTYTLEFSDGDEVVATLLYEKLEKHCTLCQMLDYEESTCPQKPSQSPLLAAPRHSLPPPPTRGSTPTSSYISGRRDVRANFSKYPKAFDHPRKAPDSRDHPYHSSSDNRAYERTSSTFSGNHTKYPREASHHYAISRSSTPQWVDTGRRVTSSRSEHRRSPSRASAPQADMHPPANRSPASRSSERTRTNCTGSQSRQPLSSPSVAAHDIPLETLALVYEEIREALIQYTSCADPTEQAARKERLRFSEDHGEIEQLQ